MNWKRGVILSVSFFYLLPAVHAQYRAGTFRGVTQALSDVFGFLAGLLQRSEIVYGATIIFSFILFFVIYGAPMKKLSFFTGEGGLGLNRAGNMAAASLAGLTCLAIFKFREGFTAGAARMLTFMGGFGVFILALVLYMIIYFGFKDEQVLGLNNKTMGFIGVAVMLLLFGTLGTAVGPMLLAMGVILIVLMIIGKLIGWGWRRRRGAYVAPAEFEAGERLEERAERQARRETRLEDRMQRAETGIEHMERRLEEAERDVAHHREIMEALDRMRGTLGG
ncbi:hypothetical protein KY339_02245 [Candidatus Woesearchaeota archaeon]|nr:hypothetical protein [Candidatus Woesearchaeota archaeon]